MITPHRSNSRCSRRAARPHPTGLETIMSAAPRLNGKTLDGAPQPVMWTVLKAMDEGSAEPFIARLMIGMLELLDNHMQARMNLRRTAVLPFLITGLGAESIGRVFGPG